MYTDMMLDLETMGNKSNSSIVSIGAVLFNMDTGETGYEFYKVVDLQSCLDVGLKVNASTIYWWLEQSESARKRLLENREHIQKVLYDFTIWMNDCIDDVKIWGNSARFDLGILHDAYDACKLDIPWDFRNEKDVRTLVDFKPEIKFNTIFKGIAHDPIDDCKHQIDYCHLIWKTLNTK